MFDTERAMHLMVEFAHMTPGAAIFYSIVVICAWMLAQRMIDVMICAMKRVCRAAWDFGCFMGDVVSSLRADYEPDYEPMPEPKRRPTRK
ncbi:hypothetical protein [Bradyrhizobium sp. Tv2a-2]|uniref:hypothetical protein n=1 Tax=Bradyrhizobium sp. Tv2a-2 TaxID=113395 RepID=UPI000415E8C3|nr:hypothetical protein [Bradyrhizobium sp. Tv2a-2]